jgi:thymidylate kinase
MDSGLLEMKMSGGYEKLVACVERIGVGPWQFIQLRGAPLSPQDIDGGDVDLLGTRASVLALFDAVYTWVRQGDCHARFAVAEGAKYKLVLISCDGKHQVDFDLWVEMRQLFHRTAMLLPEARLRVAQPQSRAIFRLPLALEVSIYVQHIVAKRRLGAFTPGMRARMEGYQRQGTQPPLGQVLAAVLAQSTITQECLRWADGTLRDAPELWRPSRRGLLAKVKAARLAPPRTIKWLALMGGDGCGKTTLGKELAKRLPDTIAKLVTGKHLYRKNLFFKLLVIVLRPLLFQSREKFDETLAPLVYALACARLRVGLWLASAPKIVLMDRSLVDFLMCNRKRDRPTFGRKEWLTAVWGCRIPTIHLVVSYERLAQRKQEMTRTGVAQYDQAMFHHFTRRRPTDYLLFNNDGALEQSLDALAAILTRCVKSR